MLLNRLGLLVLTVQFLTNGGVTPYRAIGKQLDMNARLPLE